MRSFPEFGIREACDSVAPMNLCKESVRFRSLGEEIAGMLFWPESDHPVPGLILCHGAGEFKENYFEMCERLADRGLASLAIDMHGHGQSGGERFYVEMRQWVADIRSALDFLATRPQIDSEKVGAFGLSSGGTAVLEAAIVEPRLKVLVGLDATVRNSLPFFESMILKVLVFLGGVKRRVTGSDFRVPLAKLPSPKMASDPEINQRLMSDPKALEAFMAFPLPGAEQAFFVDTISRVSSITAPTLVLWGEDDKLDPPETGRLLCEALTCKKQLQVIAGNGHVGHLDRNRAKVFVLTAEWVLDNLMPRGSVARHIPAFNTCENH